MTVVPMVKRQTDKRGWLWRRHAATEPWHKVFASVKSAQLNFFRDDKAAQPSESHALTGAQVHDGNSEAEKLPGRSNRLLSVQVASESSEEIQSSLPQCGLESPTLQLVALDANEHTQWLKLLRQAANSPQLSHSIVLDEKKVLNGFRPKLERQASKPISPTGPSLVVSAFLCSPTTTLGNDLLPLLGRARTALKEGLLNLGGARDEARRCQFTLSSVRRHMRDIDLSITHRQQQRDPSEDGAELLVEARDWVEQALSLLNQIDANLDTLQMKDAPFAYEWETFAHDTLLKLQAMEEALRLGLYASRTEDASDRSQKATGEKTTTIVLQPRSGIASQPAQPYSHYKFKHSL